MNGILYFNHSTAYLVRLAVSIYSLRRHYGGPVCIVNAEGRDGGIIDKFAADGRLGVEVRHIELPINSKRDCYVAKPSVHRWTPFDRTLFIDADTVIAADPSPLLAIDSPLVVTRFSDWNCGGGTVSGRIRPFERGRIKVDGLNVKGLAHTVIVERWPAINTGIFAFDGGSDGRGQMELWERLTQASRRRANFNDEISAQILLPIFEHHIAEDRWNWSIAFGRSTDPAIIHFHGSRHLKGESATLWIAMYLQAFELNIAGMQSWSPAGDKRLAEFLSFDKK